VGLRKSAPLAFAVPNRLIANLFPVLAGIGAVTILGEKNEAGRPGQEEDVSDGRGANPCGAMSDSGLGRVKTPGQLA